MDARIRRLGIALMLCFAALFAMLNYVQIFRAEELNAHPDNSRAVVRDFDEPRGSISAADGTLLAESVPSDDRYELQRRYPQGELFAHITGHFGLEVASAGLEKEYNDVLSGKDVGQQLASLRDLFVDRENTGHLVLNVRADVQETARNALGERKGAVVVIEPATGAVLALWSFPSYDPNRLATHDDPAAAAVFDELSEADGRPLLAKSYRDRFFPGSTFKVVTAAAGLEAGQVNETSPSFPPVSSYSPPGTERSIANFGSSACGGALIDIIRRSCNTAFAEMAAEIIGPEPLVQTAEAFGFNETPPIDLPQPAESVVPTDYGAPLRSEGVLFEDTPRLAQVAIGQNDVSATPLQMAMVAATVANGGVVMAPQLVDEIEDSDGNVIDEISPEPLGRAISEASAEILRRAMIATVESGTAQAMALADLVVGAKTGTAQLGTDPPTSNAWVIGFAGPPDQTPSVAVAVLVEAAPGSADQTGGTTAAPIAEAVLASALRPS